MRFCLFLLFLFSCNCITGQQIKQLQFSSPNGIVVHYLALNSDSTFRYSIAGDLIDAESKGNWYVKKGKLYLQSFGSYNTGFSEIITQNDKCAVDSGYYLIRIETEDSLPLAHGKIYNGNTEYILSSQGIVLTKKANDKCLIVEFLGERHQLFLNDVGNCITILFSGNDRSKIYLRNDVWDFSRNKVKTSSGTILKRIANSEL